MAINVSEHAENSDLMPVLQLAQSCDQSMLDVEQTTVKLSSFCNYHIYMYYLGSKYLIFCSWS